jgi:hypothetical protein
LVRRRRFDSIGPEVVAALGWKSDGLPSGPNIRLLPFADDESQS